MNHIIQQLTRSTNFMRVVASGEMPGSAESAQRTGAFFPNLLFLYQKTVNISRKNWFTKSFKGRQKKWRHFFLFFETLSFCEAPFGCSGRAPFKFNYVTPLVVACIVSSQRMFRL